MAAEPVRPRTLMLSERACHVAAARGPRGYDAPPPYCPGTTYPEYPFGSAGTADTPNAVYGAVRGSLALLGLDAGRYGTAAWNPLGEIVRPGDCVVLKPNFVRDFRESTPEHGDCLITHGAVLRAVADFVYLALQGRGRIIVADAPQNDADFDALRRIAGLAAIQSFYRQYGGVQVEVYDLRPERARKIDGVIVRHLSLAGDPAGYTRVNLGRDSAFHAVNHLCRQLYGAEYDVGELYRHHRDDVHEYLIAKTVLNADVVISVPKLKTHKKVGLTVNLKNLVGINGNKNWLPHHREGTPAEGGDQYADNAAKRRVERAIMQQFRRLFPLLGPARPLLARPLKGLGRRIFGDTNRDTVRSGNWYGNDTCWRMVLDLNRILYYADAEGRIHDQPVRRLFSVVDGIIGGEGNGPLDPIPKPAGLILAGFNPVAVDLAASRLVDFDYRRIPLLYRALEAHALPLANFGYEDVACHSDDPLLDRALTAIAGRCLGFSPHFGWKRHVELEAVADEACPVS